MEIKGNTASVHQLVVKMQSVTLIFRCRSGSTLSPYF